MRCALLMRLSLACAFVLPTATTMIRPVAAAELQVMSTGGAAVAQKRLAESAGAAGSVRFTVAMPAVLEKKLLSDERADVIVAPEPTINALERAGRIIADTRVPVARVGIGLAVRQGAAKPDISTIAALRAALLSAPSVVQPDPNQAGSNAGKAIAAMFEKLGIAESLKPRLVYRQAIAGGVAMIAKGEAAVGLFNISEILPIEGVALVGPLPRELQSYITFAAAAISGTGSLDAARAYIADLRRPAARMYWEAAGLEPID